ncbi:MAG TPA: DUF3581 family protein [Pseudomonadales bacterium]|nr:DUF3581 family protein [Pseudomonadales bacterium]
MLDQFYRRDSAGNIVFSRVNGSDFAKNVANDFNPLHDVDAKRFAVPGDLLFAVLLQSMGLYQQLALKFTAMVTEDVALVVPDKAPGVIADASGKVFVEVTAEGDQQAFDAGVEQLVRAYVAYSGTAFPHVLVPLMKHANVMINPARPMVMYESMQIVLDRVSLQAPRLETNADKTTITSHGKRGEVVLAFDIVDGDDVVGCGEKHMLLSGLRDYDDGEMDAVVASYAQWKADYHAQHA